MALIHEIFVGQRMVASIVVKRPDNNRPITGLEPTLLFVAPSGAELDAGVMEEDDDHPGKYAGSAVATEHGDWRAICELPAPLESIWKAKFFVSE